MNHLLRPWIWSSFRASSGLTPCDVLSSTPRVRAPAIARWHTHLHGLATAIHEICGLNQSLHCCITENTPPSSLSPQLWPKLFYSYLISGYDSPNKQNGVVEKNLAGKLLLLTLAPSDIICRGHGVRDKKNYSIAVLEGVQDHEKNANCGACICDGYHFCGLGARRYAFLQTWNR